MQRLGHKCFFLKVAMLLTNVGKKGESLVLYCACHTTTFEEDNVEKHMFSHCFATTANCNAWVISICHFDVGKTIGESLVPYFTCHTIPLLQQHDTNCNAWVMFPFVGKKLARVSFHTSPAMLLLSKGMLKNMFFPIVLQQLLKGKKLRCLGHKCLFLKLAMLLTNVGQKRREFGSITAPATLLLLKAKGMLKNTLFPLFCNNC